MTKTQLHSYQPILYNNKRTSLCGKSNLGEIKTVPRVDLKITQKPRQFSELYVQAEPSEATGTNRFIYFGIT